MRFSLPPMAQLMFRIANEEAADIRTLNPEVPEGLAAVLRKAMAKEAGERFSSGEEFAAALRPFGETPATATGVNIPAVPRPATQPVAASAANHAVPAATSGVTAAAMVAAASAPHAGETMILQAQADANKTVIIQAPPAPAPAGPAAARKPPPDVDISL